MRRQADRQINNRANSVELLCPALTSGRARLVRLTGVVDKLRQSVHNTRTAESIAAWIS
jgi:hypothetical protein